MPENPLIRKMLIGAKPVVQNPRMRAPETNETTLSVMEPMDPCFIDRHAAVRQHTQFACVEESARKRMHNAAKPKPAWVVRIRMVKIYCQANDYEGKLNVQEAAVIVMHVRPEMVAIGSLLTRDALVPLGYEKVVITHQEMQDLSAGDLLIPKLPEEEMEEKQQGPSGSNRALTKGLKGMMMKNK